MNRLRGTHLRRGAGYTSKKGSGVPFIYIYIYILYLYYISYNIYREREGERYYRYYIYIYIYNIAGPKTRLPENLGRLKHRP